MAHTHICELTCIPVCPWRPERASGTLCIYSLLYFLEMGPVTEPGARLVAGCKLRWSFLLPLLSTALRCREP